jgi:ABC-type multidrug transport system ATPase subunit
MSEHVIVARDLDVGYDGRAVTQGVSFDLPSGALLCLIGTNGSGKSTLLKTLAGLIEPVGGSVSVLGEAPGTQPARVGYLAQRPASSSRWDASPRSVSSVVRARTIVGSAPRRSSGWASGPSPTSR